MSEGQARQQGRLVLVATPIGNRSDISARAIANLQEADLIACEDTRHSGVLLKHLEIKKPLLSLHEHNEASRVDSVLEKLAAGETVALISDAGTPCISDPGQRLVCAAVASGHNVEVIPGPCALISAVAGSGLPVEEFYFGGFLPQKKGARQKVLEKSLTREECSVFYESPHRIAGSLEMLAALDGERLCSLSRELTKKFEESFLLSANELAALYTEKKAKGEYCLVICGSLQPKWFTRIRQEKASN